MALTPEEQSELDYLRARKKLEPTAMEKVKAFSFGAVKGAAGGIGELEKFGTYTFPETFGMKEKTPPSEQTTVFPTQKDVGTFMTEKMGMKEPRPQVSGYETAGEVVGGLLPAAPAAARTAVKSLVGVPSKASEMYARQAEKLGFKVSPSQVRQDVPLGEKGARGYEKENQELANRLASRGTGAEAKEIDKSFIDGRLDKVGKEFDKVYKGRTFTLDEQGQSALANIAEFQSGLPGPTQLNLVKKVAKDIQRTGEIKGEELQTIRNNLAHYARTASDRSDAHQVYELIDQIDASIARNHPEIANTLNTLRPQYRNSIILRDLWNAKGISQGNISLERLGNMLAGRGRLGKSDIDVLGELGKELRLRARWEEAGAKSLPGEIAAGKILGTGRDLASALMGTKTATARKIQSRLGPMAERGAAFPTAEKAGTLTATGTALEPFNK